MLEQLDFLSMVQRRWESAHLVWASFDKMQEAYRQKALNGQTTRDDLDEWTRAFHQGVRAWTTLDSMLHGAWMLAADGMLYETLGCDRAKWRQQEDRRNELLDDIQLLGDVVRLHSQRYIDGYDMPASASAFMDVSES